MAGVNRRYLIDSNLCIYHLQGASTALLERLQAQRGRVATSAICYTEVMLGILRTGASSGGADALALGAVLIPNNASDFAEITDLRVENWA